MYLRESMATATERFSFVFIDCPPSLDLLTVNALATADRVIVPVRASNLRARARLEALGLVRCHGPEDHASYARP